MYTFLFEELCNIFMIIKFCQDEVKENNNTFVYHKVMNYMYYIQ